jgi:hypothetical protein
MDNDNGAITLTFGDCAENHVGMQIIVVPNVNAAIGNRTRKNAFYLQLKPLAFLLAI